jgi:ADP-ribose pyrophosphatase YjhB (NUDIX family)
MLQDKVVAYITRGRSLLVFRHTEFPEAGVQVPGGSVEEGESLQRAVLREASEESGLVDLEILAYLGVQEREVDALCATGVQRQHFFHLGYRGEAAPCWRHSEVSPSDGSIGPIEFEFFWVRLPDGVPELAGGQGAFVQRLAAGLASSDG